MYQDSDSTRARLARLYEARANGSSMGMGLGGAMDSIERGELLKQASTIMRRKNELKKEKDIELLLNSLKKDKRQLDALDDKAFNLQMRKMMEIHKKQKVKSKLDKQAKRRAALPTPLTDAQVNALYRAEKLANLGIDESDEDPLLAEFQKLQQDQVRDVLARNPKLRAIARAEGKGYGGDMDMEGGRRRKKSTNPWITHVKRYHKAHPKLTYSEAMVKAKSSYRGGDLDGGDEIEGGRRRAKKKTPKKSQTLKKLMALMMDR